jgi:hypothetical protein
MRLLQTILEQIGHGDQFDRPAGRHGISHRTASAAAAADQGQPDGKA